MQPNDLESGAVTGSAPVTTDEKFSAAKQAFKELLRSDIDQQPLTQPVIIGIMTEGNVKYLNVNNDQIVHLSPYSSSSCVYQYYCLHYNNVTYTIKPPKDKPPIANRTVQTFIDCLQKDPSEEDFKCSITDLISCSVTLNVCHAPIILDSGITMDQSSYNSLRSPKKCPMMNEKIIFYLENSLIVAAINIVKEYYPELIPQEPWSNQTLTSQADVIVHAENSMISTGIRMVFLTTVAAFLGADLVNFIKTCSSPTLHTLQQQYEQCLMEKGTALACTEILSKQNALHRRIFWSTMQHDFLPIFLILSALIIYTMLREAQILRREPENRGRCRFFSYIGREPAERADMQRLLPEDAEVAPQAGNPGDVEIMPVQP